MSADLRADAAGSEYVWTWATSVGSGTDAKPRRTFRQSTFLATPPTADTLRKLGRSFTPVLNQQGEIDRAILTEMGTGRSLEQIAREIAGRFPARFGSWTDALAHVGELASRYSE